MPLGQTSAAGLRSPGQAGSGEAKGVFEEVEFFPPWHASVHFLPGSFLLIFLMDKNCSVLARVLSRM